MTTPCATCGYPSEGEFCAAHARSRVDNRGAVEDWRQPTMECPRCGAEYEDFDGFGVVHCEACGFCRHLSRDGDGKGGMVCGYCGDVERDSPDPEREVMT